MFCIYDVWHENVLWQTVHKKTLVPWVFRSCYLRALLPSHSCWSCRTRNSSRWPHSGGPNVSFKAWLSLELLVTCATLHPIAVRSVRQRLTSCLSGRWLGFDSLVWLQACRPGHSKICGQGYMSLAAYKYSLPQSSRIKSNQPCNHHHPSAHIVFHAWLVFKFVV